MLEFRRSRGVQYRDADVCNDANIRSSHRTLPFTSPHNLLDFPKSTKVISYPPFLDIPTRFLTSFLCELVISPILVQCLVHLGPLHFIILITKHELSCEYYIAYRVPKSYIRIIFQNILFSVRSSYNIIYSLRVRLLALPNETTGKFCIHMLIYSISERRNAEVFRVNVCLMLIISDSLQNNWRFRNCVSQQFDY